MHVTTFLSWSRLTVDFLVLRELSQSVFLARTLCRHLTNAVVAMNVDLTQRTLVAVEDHAPKHLAAQVTYGTSLVGSQLKVVTILSDV